MRSTQRLVIPLAALLLALAPTLPAAEEPDDLGNPEKAAKRFEKAVEKAPTDSESHYNLGLAYMKLKRWADAEASLRRAVELNAESAQFQAALGGALAKTGKMDEAVAAYEGALAKDPSRIDVQANLGQAYFEAGKYDSAIETYKNALRNKPADASAFYNNIGYAYLKKGDTDQAIRWFEKNVEADPESGVANYNLGQMYRKLAQDTGDPKFWSKAADSLVKAAGKDPKNALGLFLAGEALIVSGRTAEGIGFIDRYIALDPGGKKTQPAVYQSALDYKAESK